MSETRKLAAILVADVVGYSRLAGADEDRTLARLRGLRSDLIDPAIAAHHGRIVKRTGDGSIIEFRSVVDAVRCAIEVQNGLMERNAGVPEDRRIEFRVGIHVGDIVEESDGDLMGDGVNIAAHHGRTVKRTGDGSIIEFRSVVDAVRCAIEVQNGLIERNAGVPEDRRIEFRVGIHVGDVVEESDGDLMGEGVNIAARLEGICEPNEIMLSGAAYEHARDRLKEAFVDLGEKALKNIARPVRV